MELSNKMAKISVITGINLKLLTMLVAVFMLPACNAIKMVTITNNTSEKLTFLAKFNNKGNEVVGDLEFVLQPGGINSWHYETGKFEPDQLDEALSTIVLTRDKDCKVILDRSDVESIAVKDGMWKIEINRNLFNCD